MAVQQRFKTLALVVALVASCCVAVVAGDVAPASAAIEQKVAVSLAGTGEGACAATNEAEVWCWGAGYGGSLGDGRGGTAGWDPQTASAPVKAQTSGEQVSGGPCSLDAAGTVKCWGATAIIEDGEGSRYSQPSWGSNLPRTYGFAPASAVAGRCAIARSDGRIQCQGWDNFGESGSGSDGGRFTLYPNPPPSFASAVGVVNVSGAVSLSSHPGGYCAATAAGEVWCWGLADAGQLGDGVGGTIPGPCGDGSSGCNYDRYSGTPQKVPGIADAIEVGGTCALRTGGKVTCWGKNDSGRFQLAGSTQTILSPTDLPQFAGATDIDVSSSSTCAVMADGQVLCQGVGALGDGIDHQTPARVQVAGDGSPVAEVMSIGYGASCMRYVDGRIDCWGRNSSGQLGLGFVSKYPNDEVFTPSPVLGFGGEEAEDPLRIAVALDPATVGPEDRQPGEPVTINVTITVSNQDSEPITNATLRDLRISRVFAGQGLIYEFGDPAPVGPGQIAINGPPDVIDGTSLPDIPAEGSVVLKAKFLVETPGSFEVKASARGKDSGGNEANAAASAPLNIDSGLGLTLEGADRPTPDIIEMVATITNNSGEDVTLDWDSGLGLDVLQGSAPPLVVVNGPAPELPTELADEAQVEVRWRLSVRDVGVVVGVLKASGETTSGNEVQGLAELSVTVTANDVTAAEVQRAAVGGMSDYLGSVAEFGKNLEFEAAEEELSETEQFRKRRYDQYRSEGFSEGTSRILAGVAVDNAASERYWIAFADARDRRAVELGDKFVAGSEGLYALVSDAERRNALGTEFVEGLKTNGGYLADAFAIPVPEKMSNIWNGLKSASTNTGTALEEAAVGSAELYKADRALYQRDRLAYSDQAGGRHGAQFTDFNSAVVTELATEGLTLGAGKVLAPVANRIGQGVTALRRTAGTAEEAGVLARVGGDDAMGAATRELAHSEAAAERFGDLEYGEVIDPDELARLGGFSVDDAAAIDEIVDDVQEKFGVEIELSARTAEPASIDVPGGKGKQSYTKEKAVSEMDKLLGAPDILSGRVSVFEPKPLSAKKLAAMEAREPGFTIRYQDRLAKQQKYWADVKSGKAKTSRLVEASKQYDDGITVLSDLPGNLVEGGVEFVEQLDDATYVASKGWTPEYAAGLKQRLANHPSATKAKLAWEEVDGALTLTDSAAGRTQPIVSDYDIDGIRPKGGASFPAGKQGAIETFVMNRLKQLDRFGGHGWSQSAFDLPAENFDLAAEFIMSTSHPAVAQQTAESLAAKFTKLAAEFEVKAAKLSTSDPRRASLLATAEKFRGYTAEKIQELWKPGEKTIIFTKGRITVGSGGGGTP